MNIEYMKNLIYTFVGSMALVLLTGCSAEFENGTPEPWQREINPNENYEYTIKHPCLVNTEADFERARRKVNEGAEPWISGWQKLCDSRFAQLNYNSNPQEEIVRHSKGGNFNTAAFDAGAAYQLALRWKISGDEDYAKAAIKILNGWAKTCKGVNYKTWPDDSHRLLAAGFIGYQFAAPAELMRDYEGWKTEDFEIFKKWIDKTFYPICDDFLDNHFNSSAIAGWMSWDLPAMLTILSIGVLNDDDAKIKQALEFFYHGKGMGCIEWSVRGMHEDPEGKVKGRHLAQSQEMERDQGHATLNVGLHAYFCRTAYNMGIDLFAYNDNIVLDLCEYTAKYNLTSAEDVEMPFEPYYHPKYGWHEKVSAEAKGRARPGWELLYNHYAKVKGMNAPYSQAFAEKERPEGYGERGTAEAGDLGFGTLLYTEE